MDFNLQLPTDPLERRRLQNRVAQRKFRQKRDPRRPADGEQNDAQWSWPSTSGLPQCSPDQFHNQISTTSSMDAATADFPNSVANPADTLDGMIADPIDVSYNVSGGLDDASLWDPLPSIDGFLHSTNNSSVSVSDTSSFQSGFFQDSAFTSPSTEQTSPATSTALSSFFGGSSKQDNRHPPPAREQKNLRSRRRSSNPPRNPTSTSRNPPPTQAPHDREPSLDASSSSSSSTTSTNQGWLSTLHIAAQKGHEHILRVLLRQRNVDLDERDSDGRTALIHAVMEDHAGVAAALLAHGARISAVDCERRNALHWAVLYRREAVLRVLLARLGERRAGERDGGVIDAYDEVGWTPLHIAVERGFESGVMMLLQAGANLHSKARKCPYTGNVIE